MAEYRLSERAVADLEEIFAYTIETFGIGQAETYKGLLKRGLEKVAADPRLGRAIMGRTTTFYRYNCERHAIFYAPEDGAIFVVRMLHAAMDVKRHLPG